MPSDIFPDVKQLSDEELLRQRQINQQKVAERNAKIAQTVDEISQRTANKQAERREAVGNAVNGIKDLGKNLYYLTLGTLDPSNPYAQQQVQPQSAQQPTSASVEQTPVVTQSIPRQVPQQTMKPVVPRQAVQRPTQRPVQPAPVQQQYVDPNMVTDMLNMYMQPNYQESVANSNPVAGETAIQSNEAYEQGVANAENNKSNVVADILNQIRTGYADNRDNGFAVENLQGDPTKTGWNRFGEALGTTARMAGNPLVQGILAGAISGKINNDWGKGLEYGLQYAQNKAKSDAYERAMGKRPSILGGYGVEDYKAKNEADYKQNKMDIENKEYGLKEYKTGYEVENLKSQMKHRDVQDQQGWARIQAQISNNSARLAETRTHNRIMERIQSSRLLDSRDKHMISVEDKIYKADRNAILNNKELNDDQKAAKLFDLDTQYADNLRKNYGIDYQAEQRKVEQLSGTKPQAQQNTKQQTKSTGKGWAF